MNIKRIFSIGRESIGNFAKIKKNLKAFERRQ